MTAQPHRLENSRFGVLDSEISFVVFISCLSKFRFKSGAFFVIARWVLLKWKADKGRGGLLAAFTTVSIQRVLGVKRCMFAVVRHCCSNGVKNVYLNYTGGECFRVFSFTS